MCALLRTFSTYAPALVSHGGCRWDGTRRDKPRHYLGARTIPQLALLEDPSDLCRAILRGELGSADQQQAPCETLLVGTVQSVRFLSEVEHGFPHLRSSLARLLSASVVLDRAGALEVLEQDRFDVERELDLVADDHAAAGEFVLPGDTEVVAVDPGGRLEADPAHFPLVLLADPPGRLPLAQILDVERDRSRDAADRQLDLAFERGVAGALGETAAERDLRMVLDVEEVGAPQMLIALRFAGPDPGRVDLALEGRVKATIRVQLQPSVDVLEQTAHPRDHHVTSAKLRLGVTGFKHPGGHQLPLPSWSGSTTKETSST